MAADPAEIERRSNDMVRWARVEARQDDRVIVRAGDLVSPPIPWFALRAGDTAVWSPPSLGEQGLLICAEGELKLGMFLPGVASTAFPLPALEGFEVIRFKDGATLSYDPVGHVLDVAIPAGGVIRLGADVQVSGDVVADGVSLKGHLTTGVQPGDGVSGGPQ